MERDNVVCWEQKEKNVHRDTLYSCSCFCSSFGENTTKQRKGVLKNGRSACDDDSPCRLVSSKVSTHFKTRRIARADYFLTFRSPFMFGWLKDCRIETVCVCVCVELMGRENLLCFQCSWFLAGLIFFGGPQSPPVESERIGSPLKERPWLLLDND